MRFDDSLKTVLAADTSTVFGATSAWRQLVDLIGRGRAEETPEAIDRLRAIRPLVPEPVRAASARALAFASPGPALVRLFAEDAPAVAAPVLRIAALPDEVWIALLPHLSPTARAVLRHRRDLGASVGRALERFGSVDFVIGFAGEAAPADARAEPAVVSETIERSPVTLLAASPVAESAPRAPAPNGFPISDLVARIQAYQQRREIGAPEPGERRLATAFRFETDAEGVIRWVEGAERSALIGVSIAHRAGAQPQVDGAVAGAVRRRSPFRDARLTIEGASDARGAWRISGAPVFERASGRFTGVRGTARRPRRDESAAPRAPAADSLRQLVHELRTPANAIAGFAELIESELLGPVPAAYRGHAGAIHAQARELIAAIEDLDTAARIEAGALELRTGIVPLAPLLARTVADLAPLAGLRGARLTLSPVPDALALEVDDRAAERLIARLLAALVSSATAGERLTVTAARESGTALIALDRPAALPDANGDPLHGGDDEPPADEDGPLLGTPFALRLARKLAAELGGALRIEPRRLTLRLPTAVTHDMEQASIR